MTAQVAIMCNKINRLCDGKVNKIKAEKPFISTFAPSKINK